MSRYIDADAFLKEYCKPYPHVYMAMSKAMAEAPSIDIVFCKECKYYKQSEAFCENGNGLWQAGDECFCNYGEREGE